MWRGRSLSVRLGDIWLYIGFVDWSGARNNGGDCSAGVEDGLSVADPGGGLVVGNSTCVGGVLNA